MTVLVVLQGRFPFIVPLSSVLAIRILVPGPNTAFPGEFERVGQLIGGAVQSVRFNSEAIQTLIDEGHQPAQTVLLASTGPALQHHEQASNRVLVRGNARHNARRTVVDLVRPCHGCRRPARLRSSPHSFQGLETGQNLLFDGPDKMRERFQLPEVHRDLILYQALDVVDQVRIQRAMHLAQRAGLPP